MADWIVVRQLPLNRDLTELARFLGDRGLEFRISEERGSQVLAVRDPAMAAPVAEFVERWLAGELTLPDEPPRARVRPVPTLSPLHTPVTLGLILLSALGAMLVAFAWGQQWVHWFTFQDFTFTPRDGIIFQPVSEGLGSGQWWRLLTPAFIHFGLFHVLFNALWLWELGRRVELLLGAREYLLMVCGWAVVANVVQYLWSGPSLFGGMSGVVYALVGYIWIRHKMNPQPLLAVPPGIIVFMLVWLVLCLSGIVDQFIAGSIANGAHVGGLVIGMLWGAINGGVIGRRGAG